MDIIVAPAFLYLFYKFYKTRFETNTKPLSNNSQFVPAKNDSNDCYLKNGNIYINKKTDKKPQWKQNEGSKNEKNILITM